ncbi:MAG: ATP-binding protein, partial [Bacteroidota bacterium]
YGDIFLEDLKSYREELHQDLNIDLHYPLWKHDTRELIEEFIGLGFKAIPICINASKLDLSFLGREIDMDFLNDLPKHIDPCGENGEFHTFVYDGPIFSSPIPYKKGTVVKKDYSTSQDDSKRWDSTFWYLDLLPK